VCGSIHIIDDVAVGLEINRIDHLVVAVVLVTIHIFSLATMTGV
jgi:hypothetical protein